MAKFIRKKMEKSWDRSLHAQQSLMYLWLFFPSDFYPDMRNTEPKKITNAIGVGLGLDFSNTWKRKTFRCRARLKHCEQNWADGNVWTFLYDVLMKQETGGQVSLDRSGILYVSESTGGNNGFIEAIFHTDNATNEANLSQVSEE